MKSEFGFEGGFQAGGQAVEVAGLGLKYDVAALQ
jgi:hypothetical protein